MKSFGVFPFDFTPKLISFSMFRFRGRLPWSALRGPHCGSGVESSDCHRGLSTSWQPLKPTSHPLLCQQVGWREEEVSSSGGCFAHPPHGPAGHGRLRPRWAGGPPGPRVPRRPSRRPARHGGR
jgi:hypothetical protein